MDLLLMTPKGHGVIRGRCDLLYDPRGHGDLWGRFDLLYDPKGQLDLWTLPWPKGQAFDLIGDHRCPDNTIIR